MGQPEGTHLVSARTEGRISSQVAESRGTEKVLPEQELSVTLSDKKGCFACNDKSHNLDQCRMKYKIVTAAHQFGYATKFPFTIIQPSVEMVEKEKFYHHCVLIKSNVTNLDKGILKDELKMFWKLSGDWELRRECSKTFLASFSSENDVISCLKNPKIETLLDNKEVKLIVTRWKQGDDGSLDLVEEWFLVCGVPRIYRNWKELYQVASPFGVLIDVDEESLEVGDKEPIRLKIELRSLDGAPFSYCFAFGRSSKLVMVTVVQDKTEGMKQKIKESDKEHKKEVNAAKSVLLEEPKGTEESRLNGETKENKISAPAATIIINSERTAIGSSKPEGVQSIGPTPTSMIGEEHFRGIEKPPIKYVFKRRAKKQQVTEAINKSPSNKLDKGIGPESSSNTPKTGASTGCDMLDQKGCSEVEHQRELNTEEITPVGESKKSEEVGACRVTEDNSVAGPTINSKKTEISGDTSRTQIDQLISGHTKGVGMDQMGSGVQVQEKQDASKMDTRLLLQNSDEVGIYDSFSKMGLQENLRKGIYRYGLEKPSVVHQRGIVPLCKGLGVIHQSLSGTTETLCSGVLQRLDYESPECQALIIVPTSDLAQETEEVIKALGQFLGVTAYNCTGGTSAHADQQTLSSRVQVIVGIPDCILDMMQRHALCPDNIRMLFLDEADELLTGGSKDQICNIIQHLPTKIQIGLFSGTFSNKAIETGRRFMNKPVTVIIPRNEELKNVRQYYIEVENEELKLAKLYALFNTATGSNGIIIFVNTRDKVMSVTEDVGKHYTVSAIHEGMDQHARNTAIQKFQSRSSRILIATDLQDTNAMQVPIVINYDLPTELMPYIRRLRQQNRQFRMPMSVTINMVTPADQRTLGDITSFCETYMGQLPSDI